MEVNKDFILFNPEERHVTGLPDRLPLQAATTAFLITRKARDKCLGAFESLLMCDVDLVTDYEAKTAHIYPDRLHRLDDLSQKLVPMVAPRMIAELQDNPQALAESVAHLIR